MFDFSKLRQHLISLDAANLDSQTAQRSIKELKKEQFFARHGIKDHDLDHIPKSLK